MVRPVDQETDGARRALREEWGDQGHVRQVGPAQIRVVEHRHVAGRPVEGGHHLGHGEGHAPQVHRDVGGLGTKPSVGIEHSTGVVEAVPDIGGEGRVAQLETHFIAHGGQPAGKDAKVDGV